MTIYKISNHVHYSNFELVDGTGLYNYEFTEYVDIILVNINNPKKRKRITIKTSEFNPFDYKIVYRYQITKFLWFEKWTWLQP
ncbi:hypothetical protein qdsa001_24 [Staphylococcus phage qdsa001]|nr:hypothetical protein qdsa001_24 [Staphylococcus phage qdsa001]QXV86234.1 hypothetical protein [Staphylococcus phage SAPYZU_15]